MAQQDPEDRVVPEGRRKPSPTHGVEPRGGGKSVPIEEVDQQQLLLFANVRTTGPVHQHVGELAQDVRERALQPPDRNVPAVAKDALRLTGLRAHRGRGCGASAQTTGPGVRAVRFSLRCSRGWKAVKALPRILAKSL